MIADADRLPLIAAANRAPSVHNIQPARFRFDTARKIALIEDPKRRLFVGDPEGKDNQKSLGAALEGLCLALSERGLGCEIKKQDAGLSLTLTSGAEPDALAPFAETRATYRGAFAPRSDADHAALVQIGERCGDLHIIEAPDDIAIIARLYDKVSLEILRAPDYRAELLSWMRLSRRHSDYARDGLNAEHMALSPFEAAAAGVVLGAQAFPLLDAMHLAGPLIAESAKVNSAAGVALFHRPIAEPELNTGRRFYRIWLEIERSGLCLCPMSVLADVPDAADKLLRGAGLSAERKLVTVFRIGQRPEAAPKAARTRLPAEEMIVA
jgi:nitroreductase